MTAATRRDAQRARPIPPLLPGDLITFHELPDVTFVVDDLALISAETVLASRVADGGRSVVSVQVGRHHIATAVRPAPLKLSLPEGADPDWCDVPEPARSVLDAEPVELPVIEWEENAAGRTWSKDGRFLVYPYDTNPVATFSAIDHTELDSAFGFATREDAFAWCRKQLAATLAAERVEAEIEAVANPDGEAGAVIVDDKSADAKGLEWTVVAPDKLESRCKRFRVLARIEDVARRPTGKYVAVDTFAEEHDLRFSADLTLDEAKGWCRERSKYDVQTEAGVERIVQVRDGDDERIPF